MNNTKKSLLILLFSANCFSFLQASNEIRFERFSVNEQLSQSTVYALTQDLNDYIWLGTACGLNRYDGYEFTNYYNDPKDSTSIANNSIFSLYTDEKGFVWAGTQLGLSVYNPYKNSFCNYSYNNTPLQIYDIAKVGNQSELLLGTNNGLFSFDMKEKRIVEITKQKKISIYSICESSDKILLGTIKGIYTYDDKTKKLHPYSPSSIGNLPVSSIIYDAKTNNYWIGTLGNGVFCYDSNFKQKQHYLFNLNSGHQSNEVRIVQQGNEGKIYCGTLCGLYVVDPIQHNFKTYLSSFNNQNTIGHNSIRSILADRQGSIWIGSYYGGVSYYSPHIPNFQTLEYGNSLNGLNDNIISCIKEDTLTGDIWIGTNDGGVNCYQREQNSFRYYTHQKYGENLPINNVKSIVPDTDRNVYIGMHGGGFSILDCKTGKMRNYSIPQALSIQNSCYAILKENEGHFMLGSMIGLFQFDKAKQKISVHPIAQKKPILQKSFIINLFKDSKEKIWIATEESGILIYHNEMLTEIADSASGQPKQIIANCFAEDSQGNIWVGSSNGAYQYSYSGKLLRHYSIADGLTNNFIHGILEDSIGRLWFSTNNGMSCFVPEQNFFYNYYVEDGLPHNEFGQYAFCKTHDGLMLFGSLGGISCFRAENIIGNPFSPQPRITDIFISGKSQRGNGIFGEIQQNNNGNLTSASFSSKQKVFSIDFTVVNYVSHKKNLFAYKLEGFEDDWATTANRSVTYSNLPPGNYTFWLKSCNNNGHWCDPISFPIQVIPMWYEMTAVKIIIFLLIISVIVVIAYLKIQYAKTDMQLKMSYTEKKNSQEKLRFYINVSHELRTPLTLIIAPLEELLEQKNNVSEKHYRTLSFIHKNCQILLHTINQVLDYRKVESGNLPLHIHPCNVEKCIQNIYSMFVLNAKKRHINYRLEMNINENSIYPIDRKYLSTILMNLVTNAFKYTNDHGEITIRLSADKHQLYLSVHDTGKGIAQEKLPYIFNRFYQADEEPNGTGIGLALVKSLVENHHGSITVDSTLGEFTEFKLRIPLTWETYAQDRSDKISSSEFSVNQVNSEILIDDSYKEDIYQTGSAEVTNEEGATASDKEVILIVDDNKDMVAYLKRIFAPTYNIRTAYDGEEALKIVRNVDVDLVLSDVMMPKMSGTKLCMMIKKNMQTCHVPVILLTAKGDIEGQLEGINTGADDYIAKPFQPAILKGKIENILKTKQRLIRHYANGSTDMNIEQMATNDADKSFIDKVTQIIEENMSDEDFSADRLAEFMFMSRSSLYIKTNTILGEAPSTVIRRIRFAKVCVLLREGKKSITEISGDTGFKNPSYFSQSFKKVMGCLPTEYIKKYKGQ